MELSNNLKKLIKQLSALTIDSILEPIKIDIVRDQMKKDLINFKNGMKDIKEISTDTVVKLIAVITVTLATTPFEKQVK